MPSEEKALAPNVWRQILKVIFQASEGCVCYVLYTRAKEARDFPFKSGIRPIQCDSGFKLAVLCLVGLQASVQVVLVFRGQRSAIRKLRNSLQPMTSQVQCQGFYFSCQIVLHENEQEERGGSFSKILLANQKWYSIFMRYNSRP